MSHATVRGILALLLHSPPLPLASQPSIAKPAAGFEVVRKRAKDRTLIIVGFNRRYVAPVPIDPYIQVEAIATAGQQFDHGHEFASVTPLHEDRRQVRFDKLVGEDQSTRRNIALRLPLAAQVQVLPGRERTGDELVVGDEEQYI